ncbi:MAG: response regulator transcription factor [Anaerolineales bacterium]|nr:response regulator transcription factor [Anaerolineales bacterium]
MTKKASYRVVVVDDHALFRAGLISLLTEMDGFYVVGEARDGREALAVIRKQQPDLVLLDVNMPEMDGVDTVKALRTEKIPCRVVMLTISRNQKDLLGAIQAGADGYLLKNAEPDELRKSLLLVMENKSVLSPEVTKQVLEVVKTEQSVQSMDAVLTARERSILTRLAHGMTTQEIASDLDISTNTVKTHVRNLLSKLGAANRAEAVSIAMRRGLIEN